MLHIGNRYTSGYSHDTLVIFCNLFMKLQQYWIILLICVKPKFLVFHIWSWVWKGCSRVAHIWRRVRTVLRVRGLGGCIPGMYHGY